MMSPSNSRHYVYTDMDVYLDTNTTGSQSPDVYTDTITTGSQSPVSPSCDMSYIPKYHGRPSVYPSPERDEDSPQPTQGQKPAAKRKRENRYKNAPPAVLSRRREQNRASQRAYRERKDQRIKDLEQMLNEAKQRNAVLSQAYALLEAEYIELKAAQLEEEQQEQQQQQQPHPHSHPHAAYNVVALTFEPEMGMANNDRLDMNLFGYTDGAGGLSYQA